jgi:hypothetical protein
MNNAFAADFRMDVQSVSAIGAADCADRMGLKTADEYHGAGSGGVFLTLHRNLGKALTDVEQLVTIMKMGCPVADNVGIIGIKNQRIHSNPPLPVSLKLYHKNQKKQDLHNGRQGFYIFF